MKTNISISINIDQANKINELIKTGQEENASQLIRKALTQYLNL